MSISLGPLSQTTTKLETGIENNKLEKDQNTYIEMKIEREG